MSGTQNKGLIIAIDGVDGAGKSSALSYVQQQLTAHGYPVVRVKCPDDTGISGVMRRMIMGRPVAGIDQLGDETGFAPEEILAWCRTGHGEVLPPLASRLMFAVEWLTTYEKKVVPALAEEKIVLLDRSHFLSNIAYANHADVDVEDMTWRINDMHWRFTRQPDIALVFDVPYEVANVRLGGRAEDGGESNHFDAVDPSGFAARRDWYHTLNDAWDFVRLVDASGTKEETATAAWSIVESFVKETYVK